jgi:xanthine dehydrogenase YagS FAD-binding subunit
MKAFDYSRPSDPQAAIRAAAIAGARYLGGGTNLVDLMREGLEHPDALVDVTGLASEITHSADGGLRLGAAAKNTAVAADLAVRRHFPLLARAILAGASAQIRNMATVGGNLLQRTRCTYFYDQAARCNKRAPGSGCDALQGFSRMHAILGASPACVATHPSDMCVALAALDAVVHCEGAHGARQIPLVDFHRLPGETPQRDTVLDPGELITAVTLPALSEATRSGYRKVRDRASYAFALVSVAAALELDEAGRIAQLRLAWGGVAHKPWRASKAEAALRGQRPDAVAIAHALDLELADAVPLRDNAFKIELVRRTSAAVLAELAGARP